MIGTLKRIISRHRSKAIEFRFALPAVAPDVRKPAFYSGAFTRELAARAEMPLEQIRFLRRSVQDMNRCKLRVQDRLDASRQALIAFIPLLQQEMRKHTKDAWVPDSAVRKETLEGCAEVLYLLAQSFMAVFKVYYERPDAQFSHNIDAVRLSACRVLELFRLEQRICGLRYEALPSNRWYYANTLFHIMRIHSDVESDVPMIEADVYSNHAGRMTNLCSIFLALQVTARLDMLQWPANLQVVLAGYLESHLEKVRIQDDPGAELAKTQLVSYCGSNTFASATRCPIKGDGASSFTIDFGELDNQMREDCVRIVKAHRSPASAVVPRKLQLLSSIERLNLTQLLLRILEVGYVGAAVERESPILGMQMYVTFKEVYHYIFHVLSGKARSGGKRFVDHFAERSALIAEDHTAEHHSQWFVLLHDKRMIRLKTQETDYTIPLQIGSLVAYELGSQDRHRPRLAAVKRLYRPDATSVIIDMDRLAKYAEPVSIEAMGQGEAEARKIGALLVYDPDLGWNLLFSSKNSLAESCAVRMVFRGNVLEFQVGVLKQATTGFHLFETPLDIAQLGLGKPPEFPMPEPRQEV